MQNDKLLPCPFCGGNNVGTWINRAISPLVRETYEMHCYDCHFGLTPSKTEAEAIKQWNTRKPMELIVEQLEEELGNVNFEKATQVVNESYFRGMSYAYGNAIEIVKGGVDNAG